MDKTKIAQDLLKRMRPEEITDIIKQLEKATGVPVQVHVSVNVYTPDSESVIGDNGLATAAIGDFYKRPVKVTRQENVEEKYLHDLALVEGEYVSYQELTFKLDTLRPQLHHRLEAWTSGVYIPKPPTILEIKPGDTWEEALSRNKPRYNPITEGIKIADITLKLL